MTDCPLSLTSLCRNAVRSVLPGNNMNSVKNMPLPVATTNYMLFLDEKATMGVSYSCEQLISAMEVCSFPEEDDDDDDDFYDHYSAAREYDPDEDSDFDRRCLD